jgi:hypothetical protein
MTKSYYPKIAELCYKDKHINITIPIRIKKILIDLYTCKICDASGTEKQMARFYWENRNNKWTTGSSYTLRQSPDKFNPITGKNEFIIPQELKTPDGRIYCPRCFLGITKSEIGPKVENILEHHHNTLYKLWASSSVRFIRTDELVDLFTLCRWKTSVRGNNRHASSMMMSSYGSTYKGLLTLLYDSVKNIKKKDAKKVTLEIFPVSQERLDEDWHQYEMRKVARRL